MIDPNKAFQSFKDMFDKMTYDERETYLKMVGFSFGDELEFQSLTLEKEEISD